MAINSQLPDTDDKKEWLKLFPGNISYTCPGCFVRHTNVKKGHKCKCPYSKQS